MMSMRLRLTFFLVAWAAWSSAASVSAQDPSPASTETVEIGSSFDEGHRLFEDGDPEAAAAAYLAALDPERPSPTLMYNLATALHHSERLPEAVLWYRRGSQDDPWLQENLFLARRSLGSERLAPSALYAWLDAHGNRFGAFLIAWIWVTGLLALLLPGSRSRASLAAAATGTLLYLLLVAAGRFGPEPVVLLQDCQVGATRLPAGTEAWASRTENGWIIDGVEETTCPLGTVEAVELRL